MLALHTIIRNGDDVDSLATCCQIILGFVCSNLLRYLSPGCEHCPRRYPKLYISTLYVYEVVLSGI